MNFRNKRLPLIAALMIMGTCRLLAQGIRFEQGKTLDQLIAQAKAEHKYLFVDCYATWCGPCKQMDQEVYTKKEVGDVFSKQFIAVKVQMDETPKDDQSTKEWYYAAYQLGKNYAINAYPTFLFFGPDGKPVHKATGFRNAADFIQLVDDAQDPNKQYYGILENYKPGKLDTSELKGLARSFYNQDKSLAGKLAVDYLSRIPESQFNLTDNKNLMIQFQYDSAVTRIALTYIKNLDKDQFSQKENLNLISALARQKCIKDVAVNYITKLDQNALDKPLNQDFLEQFRADITVRDIAKNYIEATSEKSFYTRNGILFLETFTDSPKDKSFRICYDNPGLINKIMGDNDHAQSVASYFISKSEFTPVFDKAKKTGREPNWSALEKKITQKYKAEYAYRVVLEGKLDWYRFLTKTKNDEQNWTRYIACRLEQIKTFRYDTLQHGSYDEINQIAWIYVFHHATDKKQLNEMIGWMKAAVEKHPNDLNYLDTYACLLYKVGRTEDAVICESKFLKIVSEPKWPVKIKYASSTIDKMKKGEQIWLQKTYQ